MTDRPILFSGPMVRALLAGTKTQTRRIVKPSPLDVVQFIGSDDQPTGEYGLCTQADHVIDRHVRCPYGVRGDRLWVREAWTKVPASAYRLSEGVQQTVNPADRYEAAIYAAGWDRCIPKWKPSIHMPRWASRLTLRITGVRVERLQDISEADAVAEGIWSYTADDCDGDPRLDGQLYRQTFWHWLKDIEEGDGYSTAASAYRHLWSEINGDETWAANPWVWALRFEVIPRNIDAVLTAKEAA